MVVIVDYGMGNLRSVSNAVQALGVRVRLSDCPGVIAGARKIILPGVGHFGKAVKELRKRKVFSVIKDKVNQGVPFLGICLGMQLLFSESEEAPGVCGLGLVDGFVKRFCAKGLIVPHMGWNRIKIQKTDDRRQATELFKGIKNDSYFYFAHSYYCKPRRRGVVFAKTSYSVEFTSCLHKGNIWAVQFHPEKSQQLGLRVFNNFLNLR